MVLRTPSSRRIKILCLVYAGVFTAIWAQSYRKSQFGGVHFRLVEKGSPVDQYWTAFRGYERYLLVLNGSVIYRRLDEAGIMGTSHPGPSLTLETIMRDDSVDMQKDIQGVFEGKGKMGWPFDCPTYISNTYHEYGFGYCKFQVTHNITREWDTCYSIPIWWFMLLVYLIGTLAHFLIARRIKRKMKSGTCMECGYDLRATPDRCPECGKANEANGFAMAL